MIWAKARKVIAVNSQPKSVPLRLAIKEWFENCRAISLFLAPRRYRSSIILECTMSPVLVVKIMLATEAKKIRTMVPKVKRFMAVLIRLLISNPFERWMTFASGMADVVIGALFAGVIDDRFATGRKVERTHLVHPYHGHHALDRGKTAKSRKTR